jgi:hypothetical protein
LNALGFFFSSTELTFPSFSFCEQTNQRAHDNESFTKNTCPNHHHEEEAVEGNRAMPEEDNASADKDETMCENPSGCNHNYSILVQYNNELGYFKKTYLDKHPMWPKSCSDCGVLFVLKVDPNIKEKQYKVAARTPVWMCQNAVNSKHPCMYALCSPCKIAKRPGPSSPSRRKRKRTIYEPSDC